MTYPTNLEDADDADHSQEGETGRAREVTVARREEYQEYHLYVRNVFADSVQIVEEETALGTRTRSLAERSVQSRAGRRAGPRCSWRRARTPPFSDRTRVAPRTRV